MKPLFLKLIAPLLAAAGTAAVYAQTGDFKAAAAAFAGALFTGLAGLFHPAPGSK